MFNFTIPADGSSVRAKDFAEAADAVLATLAGSDEEKAQAKAAADAAADLVKAGHVGSENVYAVIGVTGNPGHGIGPLGGSIISIDIQQRQAPAAPRPLTNPTPLPIEMARSPYETGPTAAEVAREAANTGKPLEQVAEELGGPTPMVAVPIGQVKQTTPAPRGAPSPAAVVPTGDAARTQPTIATGEPSAADKKAAAKAAQAASKAATGNAVTSTTSQVPSANITAPQTSAQRAKPKPGASEKQVAKDRSGK